MKRKMTSLLLSLVMCLSITAMSASAAEIDSGKQEIYNAYLEVIEEKSQAYGIECTPASYEAFTMTTMEEVEEFAAFFDGLAVWQQEMIAIGQEEGFSDLMPVPSVSMRSSQTVEHVRNVYVGSQAYSVRVRGTFGTTYDKTLGVQVFDSSSCSIFVGMKTPDYWTTTADGSSVSSANRQQYKVVIQGNMTYSGTTFRNLTLNDTFYCDNQGGIS